MRWCKKIRSLAAKNIDDFDELTTKGFVKKLCK
jgi:hypothetical protein